MKQFVTRREVIGTIIIMVSITLCIVLTGFSLFHECITNYANVMPIYEGAQLVESESSLLNYLGLGALRTVWFVETDAPVVEQWYHLTIGDMRRAQREALRLHSEEVPPVWEGEWRVVRVDGGTQIQMQAACYVSD